MVRSGSAGRTKPTSTERTRAPLLFQSTVHARPGVVFDAFYWIINFGSFFASLLMPLFLRHLGPSVAFGVPGLLMLLSTLIFWWGRRYYVNVPPAPPYSSGTSRPISPISKYCVVSAGSIRQSFSICCARGLMPLSRFPMRAARNGSS